jgi:hypothetical protein
MLEMIGLSLQVWFMPTVHAGQHTRSALRGELALPGKAST